MAVQRRFATEDGNLSSSITSSRSVAYSDIDLTFSKRPGGDVYKKSDAAAVKQAVKNLLLTNNGEKPFQPQYGGNLHGMLFELAEDPVFRKDLRDAIISQVQAYEPRARVTNVVSRVIPDQHVVQVQVHFQIVSTNENVVLQTSISRLR